MEKEEEDLEQVAAQVSCSAAVQSCNKPLEWRRWELKFIKWEHSLSMKKRKSERKGTGLAHEAL